MKTLLLHNSHMSLFRSPAGPVAAGAPLRFRLLCDDAAAVILRVWNGEEHDYPMVFDGQREWTVEIHAEEQPGLMWYDFIIYHTNGHTVRYGAPEDGLGGEGQAFDNGLHSWQITVYDPAYQTPEWLHGATIYQIFPDRFYPAHTAAVDTRLDRLIHQNWNEDFFTDSRHELIANGSVDFYGGTLNGIRQKLGYLKDLGVTLIYLNPVFQSHSNHHYDTGDYTKVDPILGTNEELSALFEEAHALGMRVMLDGVFSHTGDDSIYFNKYGHYDSVGAVSGRVSPYYRWYTFERFPDTYRSWWGITTLPECRKDEPTYQDFMFREKEGIVPRWLLAGADGWRLDVADELSMDFLRKLRVSARKARPDAAVLGEVWEDASNKIAYGEMRCYCTGDTLDSVMNYPLREAILSFAARQTDAEDLARLINHQAEVYPAQFRYSLMNLLGSHDRARALNVLCGKEGRELSKKEQHALKLSREEYRLASARLRTCVDILCALPGCPTIYYGDEAGMSGGPDPFCRRPYPWGREDTALQAYIREKLRHFADSAVLRFGLCEVDAPDPDTIRIRRWLEGGKDALGKPCRQTGKEVFVITRGA